MRVAPVEGDDVEIEERGLRDGDGDGGDAEHAVVEDLPLAEQRVRAAVGRRRRLGRRHIGCTYLCLART